MGDVMLLDSEDVVGERLAFEAWMGPDAFLARCTDGGYIDVRARIYWNAWRARAVLAAQEVAAERERWVAVVTHAVTELEALDDETAQAQAAALRELIGPNKAGIDA